MRFRKVTLPIVIGLDRFGNFLSIVFAPLLCGVGLIFANIIITPQKAVIHQRKDNSYQQKCYSSHPRHALSCKSGKRLHRMASRFITYCSIPGRLLTVLKLQAGSLSLFPLCGPLCMPQRSSMEESHIVLCGGYRPSSVRLCGC